MNAAVIVETRRTNDIRSKILNHFHYLNKDWELFIFHSKENGSLFIDLKAKLINLEKHINKEEYNALLTSTSFWEKIPHEKILIFQHDSGLLKPGIEEFLEWDYVGSPIPNTHTQNGGLSIRSKSVMLNILQDNKRQGHQHEDTFFCSYIKKYGKLAPPDVSKKFSCEMSFRLGTLGYHAIDRYMNKHQCNLVRRQYELMVSEEEDFLRNNPGIASAIVNKTVETWNKSFNEERYLYQNLDVAEAINKGTFKSGFEHYIKYGYFENRQAAIYSIEEDLLFNKPEFKNSFNENEYLNENPDVREAIKHGTFSSGYDHYRKYGYFENRIK